MKSSELRRYYHKMMTAGGEAASEHAGYRMYLYPSDRGLGEYSTVFKFPGEFNIRPEGVRTQLGQIIHDGFQEALRAEGGNGKFKVLDVGCGRGHFLIDVYKSIAQDTDPALARKHLQLVGVTKGDCRQLPSQYDHKGRYPDINKELAAAGVEYIVDDARFLKRVLLASGHTKFNLITANQTLHYIKPDRVRLKTLREIYEALEKGGLAAVSAADLFPRQEPVGDVGFTSKINDLLKRHGLCLRVTGSLIFIKRNDAQFYFPLRFDEEGQIIGLAE